MIGNYYYGACDGFHFSDNYVTGDNVYLRELQNFFFEVLGMMSITHYGAIGDGRTNNYGPLQVAIDDANRRGLPFIYVPYGRFIYVGELINIGNIIFLGNPKAHIVNVRTGEEIPILQFGWIGDNYYSKAEVNQLLNGNYSTSIIKGSYIDLSGDVGSVVDLTPKSGENVAYFITPIKAGERYDIVGDFTYARLDSETNELMFKHVDVAPTYDDRKYFQASADGIFVISFQNTNEIEPQVYMVQDFVKKAGDTMTGPLAIGSESVATGLLSFAQGIQVQATGEDAHAEGYKTIASGNSSHAEGDQTKATTWFAHSEGIKTEANGFCSHSEGDNTIANGKAQHVDGMFNVEDTANPDPNVRGDYIHIAGNGQEGSRSNAYTLDWDGNAWFSGNVYTGSTSGTNRDAGSSKLVTTADLEAFATANGLIMPS